MINEKVLKCMNCYQTAFAPICIDNNINPQIMFLWGWGFNYCRRNNRLYDNFEPQYSTNTVIFLKKYAGIICEEQIEDKKRLGVSEIIKKTLEEGNDIVIGMDAFYCPWNSVFQEMHIDHFINIIGVDESKEVILCRDWFFSTDSVYELPVSALESVFSINKIRCCDLESADKDKVIYELPKAYEKQDTFLENYNMFREDVENANDITDLFENDNPMLCSLLVHIREHKQYREGIKFYFQEESKLKDNSDFFAISEMFENLQGYWSRLLNMLLKVCVRKEIKRDQSELSALIEKIGQSEAEAWKACRKILGN